MPNNRSELQQEVVDALVDTKAVNFDALGTVLSKHGARLAKSGVDFSVIVNWRVIDACIPVDSLTRKVNIRELAENQQG